MGRAAYGSQCRQPARLPHRGGAPSNSGCLAHERTCAVAGSPVPARLACRGTGQALARQSSTWVAGPLAHPAAITHLRPTCAASSRHAVMAAGAHLTGAAGTAAAAAPRAAQRKLKRAQARARGRRRHQRRFRPATLPCVGGAPAAHSMGRARQWRPRAPGCQPSHVAGGQVLLVRRQGRPPARCADGGGGGGGGGGTDRWSPPTRRLREPLAAFAVWRRLAERGAGARGHAAEPAARAAGLPVAAGPLHAARPLTRSGVAAERGRALLHLQPPARYGRAGVSRRNHNPCRRRGVVWVRAAGAC